MTLRTASSAQFLVLRQLRSTQYGSSGFGLSGEGAMDSEDSPTKTTRACVRGGGRDPAPYSEPDQSRLPPDMAACIRR